MPLYEGLGTITDKQTVILDIGSAYTKLGFSGEFAPRCIIPTEVLCKSSGQIKKICDYNSNEELYDLLVDFINILYFKYALISPKDRPVVIIESLLCPTLLRETLAKVLFCHYEVLSILVLPSHLVSLSTLAIDTALVLDIGYFEAIAIPVCHGMPIINAWQALPLASQNIHRNIKSILSAENIGVQNIPESTIEDIKVRCCFVTTKERIENKCNPPCPEVKYPLGGKKVVTVSGKLRESVCELFFEEDNDHQCISTMILDAIQKVGMDLRSKLAENILLIGGTVMIPGFKARLKQELLRQIKSERYGNLKINEFKFHAPPSKDNYTAWLGGAIYGCTEVLNMKSITRESYFKESKLPDWMIIKENRTV